MNLSNQALIQELERRIRTRQITLEVQPDAVKDCVLSGRQDQLYLKEGDYQLNLTALHEQMKNTQTQSCTCPNCPKDFFTFLFKNLKFN